MAPTTPSLISLKTAFRGVVTGLGLVALASIQSSLAAQSSGYVARSDTPVYDRAATASADTHVAEASHRFGIPASWIWAVMRRESAGRIRARSHAGAMGLMQVMPGTWATLRARYALGSDPYDPRDNILAGTAYLREMHDRYGSVIAMLAAYNAGPGRYDSYLSHGRRLPLETVRYVAAIAPAIGAASLPANLADASLPQSDPALAPLFYPSARSPLSVGLQPVSGNQSVQEAVGSLDNINSTRMTDATVRTNRVDAVAMAVPSDDGDGVSTPPESGLFQASREGLFAEISGGERP